MTKATTKAAAPATAAPFVEIEYLCLRYGESKEGKQLVVFKRAPADGEPWWTGSSYDQVAMLASAFKQCHPGACYAIPTSPDGQSFGTTKCRWTRRCPDEVLERALEAQAMAYTAKQKQERLVKRENSPTRGLEAPIRSLRHAYNQLPSQDRLAFETWVLFQLRRWDTKASV